MAIASALLIGTLQATPAAAAPIPSSVTFGVAAPAAAKKSTSSFKKRMAKPKTIKTYHAGARLGFQWRDGATKYQIQFATKKNFKKKHTKTFNVKNTRNKPAAGRMERSFNGLENATKYFVRVRAVKGAQKSAWSKMSKVKTKVHIPNRVTSLKATSGPGVGEVTFTWKHKRKYTSHFLLDMAISNFHPDKKGTPVKGRNHVRVKISGKNSKYVLPARLTERLGAAAGTGNHITYRFYAVNKGTAGSKTRIFPNLHTVMPQSPAVSSSGASRIRVATYNIASSVATAGTAHRWTNRAKQVAEKIVGSGAGIVGLQELSPGSETGVNTPGAISQTQSLENALRRAQPKADWRVVRKTGYTAPGTKKSTQGGRIAYDASRYELLSACADTSQQGNWSSSCSFTLTSSQGPGYARLGGYGLFLEKDSGVKFWLFSAHLDSRKDATGDANRGRQARELLALVESLDTKYPVVITADLNSWQLKEAGNVPHDVFTSGGFSDGHSAPVRVNAEYTTSNGWSTPQKNVLGIGVRLDYVLVKGGQGFSRYENVIKNAHLASDHNIVLADVYLPKHP